MRRFRNTKIIATLGPSSSSLEAIEGLFQAGVDVFRLNFSHGNHDDHQARFDKVRSLEKRYGRPISILIDLQGPKLRIGVFKTGKIDLIPGQSFRLDLSMEAGDNQRVGLPHPEIFHALVPGADLLLNDGNIRLRVTECEANYANTTVMVGGTLSDRKGVNVPGVKLPISALTAKDRNDLAFGLKLGVDWVALSFVQCAEDVQEARELIHGKAAIIAKIEKPQAIEHLEDIVALADGIMVARGDLGVEMPPEDVPILQRQIVRVCHRAGKPVAVATQMLESMIHTPVPTRAEASDVATAVYDGVDAVMLSAESASGSYPFEAVAMMNRIIKRVEKDPHYRNHLEANRYEPEETTSDAITAAARQVAHTIHASAIATFTATGATTRRAARERPESPILGITPHIETARQLCLVWGVHAVQTEDIATFSEMVERACTVAKQEGYADIGDRLVVTAGVPFRVAGSTNILRIVRLREKQPA